MAETYRVFNYMQELTPDIMAVLVLGLRDDSRVKKRMSDVNMSITDILLASCLDRLNWLVWSKTKDGSKGRNRPASVLEQMLHPERAEEDTYLIFKTADDFKSAWEKL